MTDNQDRMAQALRWIEAETHCEDGRIYEAINAKAAEALAEYESAQPAQPASVGEPVYQVRFVIMDESKEWFEVCREDFEKLAAFRNDGVITQERRILYAAPQPPSAMAQERDNVRIIREALMLAAWSKHNDEATAMQMREAAILLFGQQTVDAAMAQESGE